MTPVEAKTTRRAAQVAPPTYRLSDEQLDRVVAALPPLIAGAPLAWHRTHRKWVLQEIAAFRPADTAQAGIAGQIVVLRHTVASITSEAFRETGSLAWEGRLHRNLAALTRSGVRMERTLRLLRRRAVPAGDGRIGNGLTGDGLAREGFDPPGPAAILSIKPWQLSATGPEPAAPATARRPDGEVAGFGTSAPSLFLSVGLPVASRAPTAIRSARPKPASRVRPKTTTTPPATGGDA